MKKELNNFWNKEYPYVVALEIFPLLSSIYVIIIENIYNQSMFELYNDDISNFETSVLHIMLNKNAEIPDLSFMFHVINDKISEVDLEGGIFFNRDTKSKI